jgi:hypothetical protein
MIISIIMTPTVTGMSLMMTMLTRTSLRMMTTLTIRTNLMLVSFPLEELLPLLPARPQE